MNRVLQAQLARVLAIVLTVLPWVATLTVPRPAKAEASLSSPFSQTGVQATQPGPTGIPGLTWAHDWQPVALVRNHPELEGFTPALRDAPAFRRYLHFSRLQLDGG